MTEDTPGGVVLPPSRWITIDQDMINRFASLTQDDQWIHTDPRRAAEDGGTIAHGFLTLSLASRFAYDCIPDLPGQMNSINYGFDRIRFLTPVRAGDAVRGRFVLRETIQRGPDRMLRRADLIIDIRHRDTPALVADWLTLVQIGPGGIAPSGQDGGKLGNRF